MENTSLAETRGPGPQDPLALIQVAIEKGLNQTELTGLYDLQVRHEKRLAAIEYNKALAKFSMLCPQIQKKRVVDAKIKFAYASYDDIMRQISPILADCGITISFDTEMVAGQNPVISVICRIRVGDHYEDKRFNCPVPDLNVSQTQRMGAALSYAKRYCLCAALNIVVTDEDMEAALLDAPAAEKSIEDVKTMLARCEQLGNPVNIIKFLAFIQAVNVEDMTERQAEKAVRELSARIGKMQGKAAAE